MDRQTKIKAAYDAVVNGRMSVRGASTHFAVPRTTLQDRLAGRIPLETKARTTLTPEEETKFSQWAINMARAGFGRTRKDFLKNIQGYLNQLHELQLRFKNNNLPGKTWYYDYLQRHSELTERSASALGFERAVVTPAKVESWFEALENFLKEEDPSLLDEPARLYNADESGFALCVKSKRIMGPKATKQDRHLYLNTSSSKSQITTLCCMSATGHFVSPFIVFPGKRLTVNPTEHFRECSVGLSESGWMTNDLFVEWLEHVLVKELDECRVKRPVILFVDGSSTHKSKQASDICLKNKIILYCLQPNATHLMQPLDLSFFGSMKHHWGEAVMDFQIKNPGMSVTKPTFSLVFKAAYSKSCTAEVARAGFRKAGLFPLCKEAVLNTKKMMTSNFLVGSPTSSIPSSSITSPIPSPSLSSPPPALASFSSAAPQRTPSSPSHAEKLRVLESILTDELKEKYATRLEEGYDLLDDPFYNTWKECKLLLSSATSASASSSRHSFTAEVSLSSPWQCRPSTSAEPPQPSTSADSPQPSTSADCLPSTSAADCSHSTPTSFPSPRPSTSAEINSLSISSAESNSVQSGPDYASSAAATVLSLNIDDFLSSQTPRVPERRGRVVRKVVPNMALTREETRTYFKEMEEAKENEERKKEERKAANEERKRTREEKKRKDMEEKQRKKEERKRKAEEIKKHKEEAKERRGKGKGKVAKRLRFEVSSSSSSEDEGNMQLNDDSGVSDVCPGRVDVNRCGGCLGVYRDVDASMWVGCNECDRWFHKSCVKSIDLIGLNDVQLEELEFVCDVCVSFKK